MPSQPHTTPGPRTARTPLRAVALLLALVSATAGVIGLATADRGVVRRSAVVAGLPVEVVRPAGAPGRLPGIVVAHGLAASRQIMRGFGDTLARRGYTVELVDLTGHGANTARLRLVSTYTMPSLSRTPIDTEHP